MVYGNVSIENVLNCFAESERSLHAAKLELAKLDPTLAQKIIASEVQKAQIVPALYQQALGVAWQQPGMTPYANPFLGQALGQIQGTPLANPFLGTQYGAPMNSPFGVTAPGAIPTPWAQFPGVVAPFRL